MSRPTTRPMVRSVDEGGLRVSGTEDLVLDVLLDGRRIWSFWLIRDSEPETGVPGTYSIGWPSALARYLDGKTRLSVRSHVDGAELFAEDMQFGSSQERIAVVNRRGSPLGIDKSGRMQMTFENRSTAQVGPLLDSVELVIDALHRSGVEAFPAYGTLLGAVRDGALIGHDSDADLGYVSRHTHPVDVILESFELQRQLATMGFRIVRYSGAGFKVLVEEPDGNVRGLDVFGGFLDAGWLVLMGEIRVPFRPEWISPLGTTTLAGRRLPAPADPGRLLTATYGEAWQTPDPAFQFHTPRSTSSRLNDWFRGSTVHRSDWDRKYQSLRHKRPPRRPDPLAKVLLRREESPGLVVDVGCGRGTNAHWLARQGVRTLGLDYSGRGFEFLDRPEERLDLPLEFGAMNVMEMRHVLGYGARIARMEERPFILARHLADTLTVRGRENLWRFAEVVCRPRGRLYLEFLVSPATDDRWAQRNLLKPVDPDLVAAELAERGGTVVSKRMIGSAAMGLRFKNDPLKRERQSCRMVIGWQ